jgi:transposase
VELFEVESSPRPVRERGRADKTFRSFAPEQDWLMPPSLDDWLPADHQARFVADAVDALDLSPVLDSYTEGRGAPPWDPRLMLRLLVFGYATGVTSSRAIERRCVDDVGFRWLAGAAVPDFRSVSKFRRRHGAAIEVLLVQTVQVAVHAGMPGLGQLAVDGVKLRAAASKHKAMSYDRLTAREAELEAEIAELEQAAAAVLADAERVDAQEDARYGRDGRPADLPAELARRETRLAKIAAAKTAIEARAADKARALAETRAAERAARDGHGLDEPQVAEQVAAAGQEAAERAEPKSNAQANFTDPDSRIMKNSDGAFVQSYNAQAVTSAGQLIVAADVTDCASDSPSLLPMIEASMANLDGNVTQLLADAGYCSEANLQALALQGATGDACDYLIATGRLKHGQPAADLTLPSQPTRTEQMAHKVRTGQGQRDYARRKTMVEPVFGQITTLQNGKRLRLRGMDGARLEWFLHCLAHNIRKISAWQAAQAPVPALAA